MQGLRDGTIEKDQMCVLDHEWTDKEKRAEIHNFFKQKAKLYETDTIVNGDSRKLQLFLKDGISNRKKRKMNVGFRQPRDKTLPEYLSVVI